MPVLKRDRKPTGKPSRFAITGAGVLHVRASEILQSQSAQVQLDALRKITINKAPHTSPGSRGTVVAED